MHGRTYAAELISKAALFGFEQPVEADLVEALTAGGGVTVGDGARYVF